MQPLSHPKTHYQNTNDYDISLKRGGNSPSGMYPHRMHNTHILHGSWSPSRPSMFYLCTADGFVEVRVSSFDVFIAIVWVLAISCVLIVLKVV